MEGGEKPVDNMEIVDDTALLPQNSDKDQNAGSSPMVLAPNSLAQIPKDEVMVDQGDDDNRIGDSTPNNMLEVKTGSENQLELEDVKTPSHQELVTPKSRERNVREMKSVLNDTEVLPVRYDVRALYCHPLVDCKIVAFLVHRWLIMMSLVRLWSEKHL